MEENKRKSLWIDIEKNVKSFRLDLMEFQKQMLKSEKQRKEKKFFSERKS